MEADRFAGIPSQYPAGRSFSSRDLNRRTGLPEFLLSILWLSYGPKTHSDWGYRRGPEILTARIHDGSFQSSPRRYAFGPLQMITRRDVAESENGLASRD